MRAQLHAPARSARQDRGSPRWPAAAAAGSVVAAVLAGALAAVPGAAASQGASQSRSFNAPIGTLQWRPQAPDLPIMVSDLWGDRSRDGGFGELVQVPPGFNSGRHAHSGDFHGLLIRGEWVHEGPNGEGDKQRLSPGSYIRQAGGEVHVDRCVSAAPCVLFVFQYARADVIWPEQAGEAGREPKR